MSPEGYERTKFYYLATLSNILKGLLHWEDARIEPYVAEYRDLLNDQSGRLIMNKTPLSLVIGEAIPPALKERLQGLPLVQLAKTLEEEVLKGGDCCGETTFDWNAARTRINTVLRQYGEELPS